MDKIKTVKIKNLDGSVSEETYTISVDAKNVDMDNGKELQETIGDINIDTDGNIAYQLNNLKNNKVNKTDIIDNLNSSSNTKVLSAKQGKVLGDTVAALDTDIKKKAYFFNTVADMKAANLKDGDYVCTLGYYETNDGGGAEYKIVKGNNLIDDIFVIECKNNLKALLIIKNNIINFKQAGGRSEQDTNFLHFDNKNILKKIEEKITNNFNITIFIPKGIYCFSEYLITNKNGLSIIGEKTLDYFSNNKTVLVPLNNNQDYIIKTGGNTLLNTEPLENDELIWNVNFENLYFSTAHYNSLTSYTMYSIKECLAIDYTVFSTFNNICFNKVSGSCFTITCSWELDIDNIRFIDIKDFSKSCMIFKTCWIKAYANKGNISAVEIRKLYFEAINSKYYIDFQPLNRLTHSNIDLINIEENYSSEGGVISELTEDSEISNKQSYFYIGEINDLTIQTIQFQNCFTKIYNLDNKQYAHVNIFEIGNHYLINFILNNLTIIKFNYPYTIINGGNQNFRNNILINNFKEYGEVLLKNHKLTNINSMGISSFKINNIFNISIPDNHKYINNFYNFYNIARINKNSNANQFLSSHNSLNPLDLTLGNNNLTTGAVLCFIRKISDKLYIRAKAPEGKTCSFYISEYDDNDVVGFGYTFNFIGTGDWKWYELSEINNYASFKRGNNIRFADITNDYKSIDEVLQLDVYHY